MANERPSLDELTRHANVGTKWHHVGVQLKLDPTELIGIQEANMSVTGKMTAMYQLWLDTTPTATRRQLLDVLRLSVVGKTTLASSYEQWINSNSQGKAAKAAVRENKAKLGDVLSKSEPTFQDIVSYCEAKGLITSSEAMDFLDMMRGRSLQARAGQFIQLVQTLVEYNPDQLDVFLSILQERGPLKAVAQDIATKSQQQYYKALEEGLVSVKWSKFSLSGPPGSGKSSVMKLLLNEDPPLQHDSTAVATNPEVRITGIMGGSCWEKTDPESMKKMIAQEIKFRKEGTSTIASLSTNLKKELDLPVAEEEDHAESHHSLPPLSTGSSKIAKDIVEHVASQDKSPSLDKVHWIYGVDSGGQAAFLDIAPALIRYNSVNILTHKLDESLDDQPKFPYSVEGKQVGEPIERQITHLQLLEASIRSSAFIISPNLDFTKPTVPDPIFLVLGTFYDKLKNSKESLREKNKKLLSQFKWYLKNRTLKWYKEHYKQIIYPVNTIDRGMETNDLAKEIRSTIQDHYIEALVPVRWFLFQLELQKKHNTSIMSLSECESIGESISMNPGDVKAALVYYNDLTVFLYFPSVLPQVVFLHPQPLFKKLSDLISISFADAMEELATSIQDIKIPANVHTEFKTEGTFSIELLQDNLSSGFTTDFTPANFISLMKFLFVIAALPKEGKYFLPCVLPTCDSSQLELMKKDFKAECDPLVLTWEEDTIPQGLFPALVVSLLKSTNEQKFELVEECKRYRNAIQLFVSDLVVKILVVDSVNKLEVCCRERAKCPIVRKRILWGISSVAAEFKYIKRDPDDSFFGVSTDGKTYICYPSKESEKKMVSKCRNCVASIDEKRQLCWFDRDATDATDVSQPDRDHSEAPTCKESNVSEDTEQTKGPQTQYSQERVHADGSHHTAVTTQQSTQGVDHFYIHLQDVCKQLLAETFHRLNRHKLTIAMIVIGVILPILYLAAGGESPERGKNAKSAITENKWKLIDVLSKSEPVLRDIVLDCESKRLITSSEATYILDTMKGDSLQTRAGQLIQLVQTLVEYGPDKLDVFLSILQEKGNLSVQAVANDIARACKHCNL